jgi:NAD(P)-dependent dehydrogenase (short-subunit alcohol dehydrogenase family)
VHVLVNLAGGAGFPTPLLDYPAEQFDKVLRRNLTYVFFSCQAVARSMRERAIPGSIVNIASIAGLSAAHNVGPYGMAKSGVVSLTRTMAVEWGKHAIRVNAVAPGVTATPSLSAALPAAIEEAAEWNPLGRTPHGSDIAAAVLYLASDLAQAVTGQVIVVDSGASVRRPGAGVDLPG